MEFHAHARDCRYILSSLDEGNPPLLTGCRWFESGPGSHYQFAALIFHVFFPFLSNLRPGLTVDVLTLSMADTASRT